MNFLATDVQYSLSCYPRKMKTPCPAKTGREPNGKITTKGMGKTANPLFLSMESNYFVKPKQDFIGIE